MLKVLIKNVLRPIFLFLAKMLAPFFPQDTDPWIMIGVVVLLIIALIMGLSKLADFMHARREAKVKYRALYCYVDKHAPTWLKVKNGSYPRIFLSEEEMRAWVEEETQRRSDSEQYERLSETRWRYKIYIHIQEFVITDSNSVALDGGAPKSGEAV